MTNNRDLVQIIIPCFNGAEYLEETLRSLQKQTYGNFDCLMIDDGSDDASSRIFNEFVVKDSRFRVIKNNKNEGESYSVNKGWSHKRGNLVSILSFDDPQPKDWLESILNFRAYNPGFVVYYPNRIVINEVGSLIRRETLFDWSPKLLERDLLCIPSVGTVIDATFLPNDFFPRISEVIFPSDLIQYLKINKFGAGIKHPSYFAVWREHEKGKSASEKRLLAEEFAEGMRLYCRSLTKGEQKISESAILANIVRILQGEMSLYLSFVVGFEIFRNKFDPKSLSVLELLKILVRFRKRKIQRVH
jgi:glycosyltransferase involved in cell wall biosynthesis